MPNILYIINGNGLADQMAGSLKRIVEISRRLMERGWDVHFLTTSGTQKICARLNLPVTLHLLPASIFKKRESSVLDRAWAYLLSTLASFWTIPSLPRFDIIMADTDYFCDVIPAFYYHLWKGIPWLSMLHHRITFSGKSVKLLVISSLSLILQRFSYFLIRKGASGICVYESGEGEAIAQTFISRGFPKSGIFPVNNGIDCRFIASLPRGDKLYQACFIGGMRPSKGVFDLIEIWKMVVRVQPRARLAVVGGGTRLPEFKKRIKEEQLEKNIVVFGARENKEALKILKQSDIFIFPSYEEGWGIVICEALACGLPVVAYNLPAYNIVFDSVLMKCETGDKVKFSQLVTDLLADSELREEMKRRALARVGDFDWDKIVSREEVILNHIIHETSKKK